MNKEKPRPASGGNADAGHGVILDSINEGVFTIDLDWQVTSFNRAAEKITGIKRKDALGQRCNEVFRASICEGNCALKRAIATSRPTVGAAIFIVDATGKRIPVKISAAALTDPQGQVIGGVETFQDLRQIEELRKQLLQKHTIEDIVGRSPAITQLFDLLPQIAESESTVLIEGDSGTGKELFARAIHTLSRRKAKPFVAVNCGALPDTLLESELFGYKAGAFTDARRDKPGRFALADGGTLFLDEIGDVSPAMQVRLLRVLQERVFEPLGSIEPVRVNVRVVAATNRNLHELVRQGKFREDLFYRLHVIHLRIPGLSSRREDLPLLIEHFVAHFNKLQGKDVAGLSQEALLILMENDYPGNVRELMNIIEHCFVLCSDGFIQVHHLPGYLRESPGRRIPGAQGGLTLKDMERVLIQETLRKHRGNRGLAARALGINGSTLYRKIRELQLEVPGTDGRHKTDR